MSQRSVMRDRVLRLVDELRLDATDEAAEGATERCVAAAEALVGLVGRHAPLSEEVVSLNGVGE